MAVRGKHCSHVENAGSHIENTNSHIANTGSHVEGTQYLLKDRQTTGNVVLI